MQYVWFIWSLFLLFVWVVVYLFLKDKGSIVIVSHDQRIIDVADRVLWLEDGVLCDKPKSSDETFRDPVCGLSVIISEAEYRSVYKKKKYYFCSKKCKDAFDSDTDRYALID